MKQLNIPDCVKSNDLIDKLIEQIESGEVSINLPVYVDGKVIGFRPAYTKEQYIEEKEKINDVIQKCKDDLQFDLKEWHFVWAYNAYKSIIYWQNYKKELQNSIICDVFKVESPDKTDYFIEDLNQKYEEKPKYIALKK